MADIFISYARSDRPRAEGLAHALERTGWSVWWDRDIPPGRSFDEVIEEALSLARCVIVLWSEASVRSEWVKTQASEAAQRRILVPILADGARIPLEFRRLQAAAIADWHDLESNEGWGQLCDAVAALVEPARHARPGVVRSVRRGRLAWVAAAVVVAGSGVVYVVTRPVPAATEPVPETVAAVAAPPASAAVSAPPAEKPSPPPPVTRPQPRPAAPVAAAARTVPPAHVMRAPEPAVETVLDTRPLPIETTMVAKDSVRTIDREPRLDATPASFDVTLLYGVFRDQAGLLSVSPGGVRFHETGGGRGFELSCGALRRVATATMIADREQRLLELTADGQAYRVRAADTGARDSIRNAITRACTAVSTR